MDEHEEKQAEQAPEVTFKTKADFTEFMERKIGEALAPKLAKIEKLSGITGELEEYKAKIAEYEEAAAAKNRTVTDKWEAERAQMAKREQALKEQIQAKEAESQAITARWHAKEREQYLVRVAAPYAAKEALADIPVLFPSNRVQVRETESGVNVSIVDPETGLEQDPAEAMRAWLETKPHFKAPAPRGAGAVGAGPTPTRRVDPLEGKSESEMMRHAIRTTVLPRFTR